MIHFIIKYLNALTSPYKILVSQFHSFFSFGFSITNDFFNNSNGLLIKEREKDRKKYN